MKRIFMQLRPNEAEALLQCLRELQLRLLMDQGETAKGEASAISKSNLLTWTVLLHHKIASFQWDETTDIPLETALQTPSLSAFAQC